MKQIFIYAGVMLLLASCLFFMYYRAGRFSNTYEELEKNKERLRTIAVERNDTARIATGKTDTLHKKE